MIQATESNWDWLFALPQLILLRPSVRYVSGHIKRRLQTLESGNLDALVQEWRAEQQRLANPTNRIKSSGLKTRADERVRTSAISALSEGYPGVDLRRLDPKPILEPAAALERLIALHPPEEEPELDSTATHKQISISNGLAFKTLQLIPSISAPGPSDLRPCHFDHC